MSLADATAATTTTNSSQHNNLANAIRALSMDAVQAANSGHPGMPMGMADVATVLFTKFLKYDASWAQFPDRDRFVLSAGHGSMLLYSLLYLNGYDKCDIDQLRNFRQLGSMTAGHPEIGHLPGIETTTGPLGQGLANAVGMALAESHLAARYGTDIVDHYTYAIAGDGCLMEGISQEAISMAGHWNLNKLIVLWDDNGISIDGHIEHWYTDDTAKRFEAYGWNVIPGWIGSIKVAERSSADISFVGNRAGSLKPMKGAQVGNGPDKPAPPLDAKAEIYENDAVKITWTDKCDGEAGFRIDRKIAGGKWTPIAYRPPQITGHTDNRPEWIDFLAPSGKKLIYRIVALNAKDDNSGASKSTAAVQISKGK